MRALVGEHADDSESLFKIAHEGMSPTARNLRTRLKIILTYYMYRGSGGIYAGCVILFLGAGLGAVASRTSRAGCRIGVPIGLLIATLIMCLPGLYHMFRPIRQREISLAHSAWQAFVRRSYWGRTWIIQEIALAQRLIVHCGPNSMDWKDLVDARLDARVRVVDDGEEEPVAGSIWGSLQHNQKP